MKIHFFFYCQCGVVKVSPCTALPLSKISLQLFTKKFYTLQKIRHILGYTIFGHFNHYQDKYFTLKIKLSTISILLQHYFKTLFNIFADLLKKRFQSGCQRPCSQMHFTLTKSRSNQSIKNDSAEFIFNFDSWVRVEESRPAFT